MLVAVGTNKAGEPTTLEVAEAVERMRDALWRQYGERATFVVHLVATESSRDVVGTIAASIGPEYKIHAVIRE